MPNSPIPKVVKFRTPLNCAARKATEPMLMRTLSDFDADAEACGVDGMTPLLYVARGRSTTHATLILDEVRRKHRCDMKD